MIVIMKRIKRLRILNICIWTTITISVVLGLFAVTNGDGDNRFREGKIFGSSLAIISILILTVGIISIDSYKKTRSIKKVLSTLKEAGMIILNNDWRYNRRKKR